MFGTGVEGIRRSGLPRSFGKYIGIPSGPGALWGRALERANVISSSVINADEDYSAG